LGVVGQARMPTDASQQSAHAQGWGTLSTSTIGEDLTIIGNVTSKSEIHLDGHVQGDVRCVALVLGESSQLKGNVIAEDVVIRGRLIGSVRALRVMLQSTAHVEGDLLHKSLAIEQGAYFEGNRVGLTLRCCPAKKLPRVELQTSHSRRPKALNSAETSRRKPSSERFLSQYSLDRTLFA
jgi:cytoskeletal protein CcmA (bactofilin family)